MKVGPVESLLIATSNPHKVVEIRAVLEGVLGPRGAGLRLVGLGELGVRIDEPEETGATFEANATIKAKAYARASGLVCLADDSGLEVDGLGGRPGVISSHYATGGEETGIGRAARDAANNARVLAELEGVVGAGRRARFRCVVVVAEPMGRVLRVAEGVMTGRIGEPPRVPAGSNGFGYDPLFVPDGSGGTDGPGDRTAAELEPEAKNRLSHRGAALRALAAGWGVWAGVEEGAS